MCAQVCVSVGRCTKATSLIMTVKGDNHRPSLPSATLSSAVDKTHLLYAPSPWVAAETGAGRSWKLLSLPFLPPLSSFLPGGLLPTHRHPGLSSFPLRAKLPAQAQPHSPGAWRRNRVDSIHAAWTLGVISPAQTQPMATPGPLYGQGPAPHRGLDFPMPASAFLGLSASLSSPGQV